MKNARLGIHATVVLAIPLALPAGASGVGGTLNWTQSQVSAWVQGFFTPSPRLAFDHYGTPSVAWASVTLASDPNTVNHSQLLGLGMWSHRQVASGQGIGLATAIAFDRAERPTVAWLEGTGAVMAEFNAGGPQTVSPNGASWTPAVLSLSYDLAGDLRGLYSEATPGNFSEVSYSGGSFSSAPLSTIGGWVAVLDAALATDHRGFRHIVAKMDPGGGGSHQVVIASEPQFGGPWPSQTLSITGAAMGVDIAIDPTDGRVALAYTSFDGGSSPAKLYYAKFNGSSLDVTEVATSMVDSYEDLSLAFDRTDGRPAIAFERRAASNEELVFAYMDAALQWQTSLVDGSIAMDAPQSMPRRPSLAFDDFGTSWPAIAYVDADESLMAAFDPPVPEPGALGLLCLAVGLVGPCRSRRCGPLGRSRRPGRRRSMSSQA